MHYEFSRQLDSAGAKKTKRVVSRPDYMGAEQTLPPELAFAKDNRHIKNKLRQRYRG